MSFDHRHAVPSLAIMGIGILTLAVVLKAAQTDMPLDPPWIMGIVGALYIALALLAEGLRWQALLVLAAMAVAHAFTALLMGWGYSAVEGSPRAFVPALQHGLWDYLPGTALQFGFACLTGIVLDLSLEPRPETPDDGEEAEEIAPPPAALPDVAAAPDLAAALAATAALPGVAGVLVCAGTPLAAGVWAGDPEAAWQRVHALAARAGAGLHTIPLETAALLLRSEDGRAAALLVTPALDRPSAHEALRRLWAAAEKEWGAPA